MPYTVHSHCSKCNEGDEIIIGFWTKHLGVYTCSTCKALVNIPLNTGKCECGHQPSVKDFYDYAPSIPYIQNMSISEIEPGPICPKCTEVNLTFNIENHFNVGRLGSDNSHQQPWIGKDYLEKAIFVYAMMAICAEFELDPEEILNHYNLDVPVSLIADRQISLPILLDIRGHLIASAVSGESTFTITDQMRAILADEMGDIFELMREEPSEKSWWQFWK